MCFTINIYIWCSASIWEICMYRIAEKIGEVRSKKWRLKIENRKLVSKWEVDEETQNLFKINNFDNFYAQLIFKHHFSSTYLFNWTCAICVKWSLLSLNEYWPSFIVKYLLNMDIYHCYSIIFSLFFT